MPIGANLPRIFTVRSSLQQAPDTAAMSRGMAWHMLQSAPNADLYSVFPDGTIQATGTIARTDWPGQI